MTRSVLIAACLTGFFCAIFAVFVDAILDQLNMYQVMLISALSGFLGSLFAHFVLRRGKTKQPR